MSSAVTGFKKMNWLPKQSAWDEMEAARLKRREMMQEFPASSSALASGFQAAQTMQIQGVGELAAQGVQARMDAKVKEMQAKLDERYTSFSKIA